MYARLKLYLKKKFNLPIYRVDVLKVVKETCENFSGLCIAISCPLSILCYNDVKIVFPLFGTNVKTFGGDTTKDYWWPPKDWSTGRLAYLDWLIEQYKDDRTNIREYVV